MKFQFFRKYSPFAYFARLSKESRSLCAFFAALIFSAILLSQLVNLTPQVGSDFFFSSDNPKFQYARLIGKIFPQEATQLVISAKGDISSADYLEKMRVLTDMTMLLPGVSGVVSLTSGPRNIRDASDSPLWKRLLISDDGASSNMLAFLENVSPEMIIPKFETLIGLLESPGFNLQIAGVPYVVEMIRRNLVHDLVLFSLVAFVVFGTVMVFIFRSLRVFVGTFISCLEACILTLLIVGLSGIKIGILTVNLATIVFVLTLSHIIFLTHNWRTINRTRPGSYDTSSREAVRMTFGASFWCMMTTLLGFLSLLFVEAKPLRELGISGAVGTLVSISAAYGIYPLFLKTVRPSAVPRDRADRERARAFFIRRTGWIAGLVLILCAVCLPGLARLNTDPSLFSFFKKGSRLREGLEYIDRNGGSSPLDIVVRDAKGARLNTNSMYERMWDLQEALEEDRSVGSAISLPVLMAEGGRAPLAFLLTWESLLKWMNKPQYNKIARSFITDDHVSGHFLLRMRESGRTTSRIEVVERLKNIVRKHGFVNEMAGGLFLLQGELAKLVSSSLVFGLARLIAFFVVISFIVSRSLRISLAMVFSLSVIPVCVLGGMGLLRVPVDIISAPAVNIAIGMGIDSMIHLVTAVRRRRSRGMDPRSAWLQSRARLWKPILGSMFIVSAGFAIFALSAFPPTQRFGLSIVLGTMLASVSTVFLLPLIANIGLKEAQENPPFRQGPRLGKTRPDEVLTR